MIDQIPEMPSKVIEEVQPTFNKIVDQPVSEEEIISESPLLENKATVEKEITYSNNAIVSVNDWKSESGLAIN